MKNKYQKFKAKFFKLYAKKIRQILKIKEKKGNEKNFKKALKIINKFKNKEKKFKQKFNIKNIDIGTSAIYMGGICDGKTL